MLSDLLVLLEHFADKASSRILAFFRGKKAMSDDKDSVYDETPGVGKPPKPGSVDPKAPLDEGLYEETNDEVKPPKPGSVDPSGPTDTSHDFPE